MAVKKKSNQLQMTVEKILKKKGVDYREWEKDIINQRKLEIMAGEDKEWTKKTIEEESMNLIMDEVIHSGITSDIVSKSNM
ncbi:hypothetical protein DES36_1195 [Alkalibaculum bacchi]|uniref:Uncharacterized protein n=1 Tax=Alkalibaculum bacchi TaxID=645887 RepID=A0A366HZY5_9FIRM|nr:hypothetical protein [Alkalibaculum bacchi]RBP59280.1 hypothetical protein DES36_1195 [Alkalibaculum bacchi]